MSRTMEWACVATLAVLAKGCAIHGDGVREVAAYIDAHAASRESTADAYARTPTPAARPAPGETAEEPVVLEGLRDLIAVALERNPDVRAAEETARSEAEHVAQVTALPDPILTTKTLPEPVRTAEGDNYFILGISERFPVLEKLDDAGRIALEDARRALDRLQEVRLRVIADVKRAYFELYVLDKSISITQENQRLLRGLIDVARAQVAASRRPQDDALRAQLELSNLEAELVTLRQRRVTSAARINELLDRASTTPVTSPSAFEIRQVDVALDEMLARAVELNPALRALQHRVERDRLAVELARLAYWPDFTLGFEWMYMEPREAFRPLPNPRTGQRPLVSQMSEDGTDNWAITFGFTLPIWFDKIKAGINEATHRLLAAQHGYAAAQRRVEFEVEDALERVRAQRELAALFDTTIIPQARQTFEVSQASYVAGATDFLYVIDNWRKWLAVEVQYHRSLGELERSVADLEQIIGMSLTDFGKPR